MSTWHFVLIRLFNNLNQVSLESLNTTFIISVPSNAWSADYGKAISPKRIRQLIHFLFSSHTESEMDIACLEMIYSIIHHIGTRHNFQS